MNNEELKRAIVLKIAESIDIPDSAYDAAAGRYSDLATWFCDSENAKSAGYDPHIFPQGSFRLGLVTRPINKEEQFDLDIACNLMNGITMQTSTQEQLKKLIGADLENYRNARHIQSPLEAKHRCWTLDYQDQIGFHMDIIPCIPQDATEVAKVRQRMLDVGLYESLANSIAELSISITDDRKPSFRVFSEDWLISNPEGFACWFESRMKLA